MASTVKRRISVWISKDETFPCRGLGLLRSGGKNHGERGRRPGDRDKKGDREGSRQGDRGREEAMEYLADGDLPERRKKRRRLALLAAGWEELELDPELRRRTSHLERETGMKDAGTHWNQFLSPLSPHSPVADERDRARAHLTVVSERA
ncbi:hypothetical protein ACLOJK_015598 [Asimina triloba]